MLIIRKKNCCKCLITAGFVCKICLKKLVFYEQFIVDTFHELIFNCLLAYVDIDCNGNKEKLLFTISNYRTNCNFFASNWLTIHAKPNL